MQQEITSAALAGLFIRLDATQTKIKGLRKTENGSEIAKMKAELQKEKKEIGIQK